MTDPIVTLWTADARDATGYSPDQLRARAAAMHRRLVLRDAAEYAAAVPVIGAFGWIGWNSSNGVECAGAILVMLGMLLVMRNLWVRRMPPPPAALGAESATFYRDQLVRQRDALRSVGRWYLGPMIPGMALFVTGAGIETAANTLAIAGIAIAALGGIAIGTVFLAVHRLNQRAAARMGAEIDALDAARDLP